MWKKQWTSVITFVKRTTTNNTMGNKNSGRKRNKLTKKYKAFVDTLFTNGFNQADAYCKVFDITNRNYAKVAASRLMQRKEVAEYYDHKYKEYRETLDFDKQKLQDTLMSIVNDHIEIKRLAKIDDPDEDELLKLMRLKSVQSTNDTIKVIDMLNKMAGYYEAEKQEITHKGITINYKKPNEEDTE